MGAETHNMKEKKKSPHSNDDGVMLPGVGGALETSLNDSVDAL